MKNSLIKVTTVILGIFSLVSCDKDFNSIGSDLIDDAHYNLEKYEGASVVAYSKATGAVQSNNLPVNALGIYKNPVFGTTTAHFVTQAELQTTNPTIGYNIDVKSNDSVYVYIPYFSTLEETVDGNNTYTLDSIYGDVESSFNLKIFKNNYLLRDYNPSPNPNDITTYNQKYFNNDKSLVENNLGAELNNSSNTAENMLFKFDKNEIIKYKTDENGVYLDASNNVVIDPANRVVKERTKPGMWINLDKQFFEDLLVNAGTNNLLNNTSFKEYFRGLYFQVNANSGQDGALAMLDFKSGYIKIQFHSDIDNVATDGSTTVINTKKNVQINLTGNCVNFYDYSNDSDYQTKLTNSDATNGDDKLYLKGGNGSVAYLDLFGADADADGVPDELETIRNNGWLINEANLVFYIDNNTTTGMGQLGVKEPRRIYLYDATNSTVIADYLDNSAGSDPKLNKFVFGGIIEEEGEDPNKKGVSYKIRITEYINRIINSDDETLNKNVRLGLCVTENINVATNSYLKNPVAVGTQQVKLIPTSSVMNPLGTILFGNNILPSDTNYSKRLKLQIFYTKPN